MLLLITVIQRNNLINFFKDRPLDQEGKLAFTALQDKKVQITCGLEAHFMRMLPETTSFLL